MPDFLYRFPRWHSGKESTCKCRRSQRCRFCPWLGGSPGVGNGNLFQYSCLKKLHGERSLLGYSPWDCKESDTTAHMHTIFYLVLEYVSPWGQIELQCPRIPHSYAHSLMSSSAHLLCSSSHYGIYRTESSPEALGGLWQRGWKTVSLRTV